MENKNIRDLIPFAGLILIIIVFSIITYGKILSIRNIKLIIDQSLILIIACAGVSFVMSIGSLDFSQGSLLAISSLAAAVVSKQNVILSFFVALSVGTAIGLLNGVLLAKVKIPSFIVTICTLFIFRGFTIYFTRSGAYPVALEMNALDNILIKIPITMFILAITYYLFTFTTLGRQCRAIGAGETSAVFSGVHVKKVKIIAFAIAGFLGGICSILSMIRTGVAAPTTGLLFETDVLTALVLGGMPITGGAKSKIRSGIIGGLILAFLGNGLVLMGVEASVLQLVKGIIFLTAVYVSLDREGIVVIK